MFLGGGGSGGSPPAAWLWSRELESFLILRDDGYGKPLNRKSAFHRLAIWGPVEFGAGHKSLNQTSHKPIRSSGTRGFRNTAVRNLRKAWNPTLFVSGPPKHVALN
jgi:hypothetical protein